jgi:hypothetical protein
MHLIQVYATSSGSKIGQPFIYTTYFPLGGINKYITFQAQSKYNSKNYDLFQDVINILFPVLEKHGIKILQVGGPNEFNYQYCVNLVGKTDIHQLSYVIKNSQLHLGPDSLGIHLASYFNVPIVGLYSCSSVANSGPYWGDRSKHVLFEGFKNVKNKKPSYSAEEFPKSINTIKPEEIAKAVFKLLNIEQNVPFETIHIGEKYSQMILREMVPNANLPVLEDRRPIEVRMDLNFNESILERQLQVSSCAIVTNKRVSLDLLQKYKGHVAAVVYEIDKNDDPSFAHEVRALGLNLLLISYLSNDDIREKKINYYDLGLINKMPEPPLDLVEKLKSDMPKLYFKSNKIISSNGQFFMTDAARVTNQPITNDWEYFKAQDIPEFWRNLPFMTIVSKV